MNFLKKVDHRPASLIVRIRLEPRKDFAGHHLLARAGNKPVIQKDRRSWMPKSPDADLFFPEGSFKLFPVPAVGRFNIGALFEQSLKNEVLDQICGGQYSTAGVQ